MGIFGALTTAVTGMRAQSFALENVSGNIANSQTTAFKRMDTSFVDLIPDERPSKQLAGNVVANSRSTNTVQGDIQTSSIGTFMAINGDGFFVVQKPSSFVDNRPVFDGIDRYTRRGDFQPDKNGYLVNGAGYYLMGIPVDPTTGNLVGSVPQLLQFQNDFLPAQPTSQIEYRVNLASYPLTPDHDVDVPKSELLNPATFSANPIAGAPTAAKITGAAAQLADILAEVTGTGTFAVPATTQLGAGNGGMLRITITPAGGSATNYDITLADTDTLNSIVAAINGTAGLSTAITASVDTTGGTNKLKLVADSADYDFAIGAASTDATTTRLGLSETSHTSSNLLAKGVSQGETLTVTVGTGPSATTFPIVFGTGPSEVSTLAELTSTLAGYPSAMGTATVDANGNLTLVGSGSNDGLGQPECDGGQTRHQRIRCNCGKRVGDRTGRVHVPQAVDRRRRGHLLRRVRLAREPAAALGEGRQLAVRRHRHLEPVLSGQPQCNRPADRVAECWRQLHVRRERPDEPVDRHYDAFQRDGEWNLAR